MIRSEFVNPAPKRMKKSEGTLNVFSIFTIKPSDVNSNDLLIFYEEVRPQLKEKLMEEIKDKSALKWYAIVQVVLKRLSGDEEEQIKPYFRSKCVIDLTEETFEEHIQEAFDKISKSHDEFTQRGSGWVLDQIIHFELHSSKYEPLAASSHFKLPKKLVAKKAVLNIQNTDEKCFLWCILAHKLKIASKDHAANPNHYKPYENTINMKDIPYPVPISKVKTVEKLNDLRINIFGYEEETVFPLYISDRDDEDCINLLYIANENKQHYCLIRNMSRLLSHLTKHDGRAFYCNRCLHRFMEEQNLMEHLPHCTQHSIQRIKMPAIEDSIMEFTNLHYQHSLPFTIYADFESLLNPISTAQPNITNSFTTKMNEHQPCGYAYVVVGPDGKSVKPITVYRGKYAVDHFLLNLLKEKDELAKILTNVVPIQMTPQDEENFKNATHCSICKKPLGTDRCRDHCHITGRYRSALHNECNLNYRLQKKIPVIFHNLKHYDAHLIMQGIGKLKKHHLHVIATNIEKYIAFSLSSYHNKCKVTLQFLDSFQFMGASLEKLVANLSEDKFHILKENIPSHHDLLLKKGVYPYEYINDFKKFEDTTLPPKDAFYSTLTQEHITDEDYAYAQSVWETFNIRNLGEYHDLYVKSDVLQLADVFENFRKICLHHYELDCTHMVTAPGLAWQACLKMTQQPLELFTDPSMHLFVEAGIRGGISTITTRYAKANNPYLEDYDSNKPTSYIVYLDANNLYGWAMSQPLPYGGFEWVSPEGITTESIENIPDDADEGFMFEADLDVPEHLHDFFNDYPLAPEKLKVDKNMLSPPVLEKIENTLYIASEKLIPNLYHKKNYILHYRNLKLYLSLGLILTKVHKVLKFKQRAWLKSYIDFNTHQRKISTSTFEKNFFKLMNNAVYGKTMENVRKRKDIQLVNNEKKAKKLVASPAFHSFKIFCNDLVGVERIKKVITLDKPLYAGFAILELSKLLMYQFHYHFIKNTFQEKATLLFTDTDSLTYHIETPDIYETMAHHHELFDFSDYPQEHPLHSNLNKKKIGCFKDELNSEPAKEFVGLRAKMYSLLSATSEKKTAKGVSKSVMRKKIKHEHYKEVLLNSKVTRETQYRIQSDHHNLFTICQNKIALSSIDDKRYILDDGIHTLAHGHYKIAELKGENE